MSKTSTARANTQPYMSYYRFTLMTYYYPYSITPL